MKKLISLFLALAAASVGSAQINVTKNSTTGEVSQNFTIATGKSITLNGSISGPGSISVNLTGNLINSTANITTLTTSSLQVGTNGTVATLMKRGTVTLFGGNSSNTTINGALPTSMVFLTRNSTGNSTLVGGALTVITTTNSITIYSNNGTAGAVNTISAWDNSTVNWMLINP